MQLALDFLAATPPTEFGGPYANAGFAYQRSWTVCMLIELHKADGDYLVICDYHDDILVLEGGISAATVDFYQVKTTNKKPWTIARLLKQERARSGSTAPSVLGKLFRHKRAFAGAARKLVVVCNLPFSIETREGADITEDRFSFAALTDENQLAVTDAIKTELQLPDSPNIGVSLLFQTSTLNLSDHENGTRGRLEELLRTRFPDRAQFPVHPIYQVLADEIERLSRCKDACSTSTQIVSLKGFQRQQFEEYIVSCVERADRLQPHRVLTEVTEELRADGVPFSKRKRIVTALERYSLERMDTTRADLAALGAAAEAYVSAGVPEVPFSVILQEGTTHLRRCKEAKGLSDDYLMAIVAWEVLTNGWELPAAAPQPEKEAP